MERSERYNYSRLQIYSTVWRVGKVRNEARRVMNVSKRGQIYMTPVAMRRKAKAVVNLLDPHLASAIPGYRVEVLV